MYRRFYHHEERLQEIISRLEELYTIKLERHKGLPTDSAIEEGATPAWTERKAIDRLAYLIDDFRSSINYGESELDQNEALAAIDKLIETDMVKEAGHSYAGKDRVKIIRNYFSDIVRQKQDAYRVFARLVDEQRVRMLAIKMLATSVGYSATHREKDTKLRMMIQNIDALIHDLTGIDKDHPEYYEYGRRHSDIGSWDYAKAITQLHHENSRVRRMEKEVEELRAKLAAYEGAVNETEPEPVEQEVKF